MKIGIYGQFYHENSETYIQRILDALQRKNIEIVIEENFLRIINQQQDITKNFSEVAVQEAKGCVVEEEQSE